MAGHMSHAVFVQSIEKNLAYWRAHMGKHETEAIMFLEDNQHNLYQTLQVGLRFPETQNATTVLVLDLYEFIESRHHTREWIPILITALSASIPPAERCRLLNHLGYTHAYAQKFPEATQYHQQALTLSQEIGNAREELNGYFGLGHVQFYQYEYAQANRHVQMALDRFSQVPPHPLPHFDQAKLAAIYSMLGIIAHVQGDYDTAEMQLLRAVEIRKTHPNREMYAHNLRNLALTYSAQQKKEVAHKIYQDALAIHAQTGNIYAQINLLNDLGTMYFQQRQYDLAEETFQKVDQGYLRRIGDLAMLASLENNLGNVYLQQGRLTLAQQYLTQVIEHWRELNDDLNLANSLCDLAETYIKLNELVKALPLYLEAIPILTRYPQDAWARRLRENALAHARKAFPDHPAFV